MYCGPVESHKPLLIAKIFCLPQEPMLTHCRAILSLGITPWDMQYPPKCQMTNCQMSIYTDIL